jgi:hypothetical protein
VAYEDLQQLMEQTGGLLGPTQQDLAEARSRGLFNLGVGLMSAGGQRGGLGQGLAAYQQAQDQYLQQQRNQKLSDIVQSGKIADLQDEAEQRATQKRMAQELASLDWSKPEAADAYKQTLLSQGRVKDALAFGKLMGDVTGVGDGKEWGLNPLITPEGDAYVLSKTGQQRKLPFRVSPNFTYMQDAGGNIMAMPSRGTPTPQAVSAPSGNGPMQGEKAVDRREAYNADYTQLQGAKSGLDRLAQAATEALNAPGLKGVTGMRGMLPDVPGSDAANARAKLETLKSQVAFGVLQDMRNASKTGGALGSVSDAEGRRLESNLAALANSQSEEQMRQSLQKIVEYANSAKGRMEGAFSLKYGNGPTSVPTGAASQTGRFPSGYAGGNQQAADAQRLAILANEYHNAPDDATREARIQEVDNLVAANPGLAKQAQALMQANTGRAAATPQTQKRDPAFDAGVQWLRNNARMMRPGDMVNALRRKGWSDAAIRRAMETAGEQ